MRLIATSNRLWSTAQSETILRTWLLPRVFCAPSCSCAPLAFVQTYSKKLRPAKKSLACTHCRARSVHQHCIVTVSAIEKCRQFYEPTWLCLRSIVKWGAHLSGEGGLTPISNSGIRECWCRLRIWEAMCTWRVFWTCRQRWGEWQGTLFEWFIHTCIPWVNEWLLGLEGLSEVLDQSTDGVVDTELQFQIKVVLVHKANPWLCFKWVRGFLSLGLKSVLNEQSGTKLYLVLRSMPGG